MENSKNLLIFLGITIVFLIGVFFILNKFGGSTAMANEKTIAQNGDTVSVHYTGKLENGEVFDSSLTRGVPFEFELGAGEVIQGWDEGILGMKKGEKKTLTIPADKGYGARGVPGVIPENATLIFDVELVDII